MANTKHLPLFLFLLLIIIITTSSTSSLPLLTAEQNKLATKIIDAMISGGTFDDWSEAFLETNDEMNGQILNSTLFVPITSVEGINATSPLVASYHIVPQRLDFSDISLMRPFSSLRPYASCWKLHCSDQQLSFRFYPRWCAHLRAGDIRLSFHCYPSNRFSV